MRLVLFVVLLLAHASTLLAQSNPPVAFVGATVITMEADTLLLDHTVIVRDGRITAVGPRGSTPVPAGTQTIDATGKFLMPGLADMHAHLAGGNGELNDGAGRQLAVYLALGVTSVRALMAPPSATELKARVSSGKVLGPRLWVTGQSVHGQTAPDAGAVVNLVEKIAASGADVIKTHGNFKDRASYDSLVAASRRAKLPLAGHVSPEFGLAAAVEAGQQIEHLDGMLAAAVPASVKVPPGQFVFDLEILNAVDSARIDSLAQVMVARGIYHGPTLALFRNFVGAEPPEVFLRRPDLAFTPRQAIDAWTQQRRNQIQAPISPEARARLLAIRDLMVRRLHAFGVPLLAGSDSPSLFQVPGYGLHRELEAMVQAGLSPYHALVTATRNPARYLGREDVAGTIAVGKEADLVLLDANPLRRITNSTRVHGTMIRGRWLGKAELDETMRKVADAVKKL